MPRDRLTAIRRRLRRELRVGADTVLDRVRAEPLAQAAVDPTLAARLDSSRSRLTDILTRNILPFWYPDAIDRHRGGYRQDRPLHGGWLDTPQRHAIAQTRVLWLSSRLARSDFAAAEHLEAAHHGYEFLRDRLWDPRSGGLIWELDLDTGSVQGDKLLLAQMYGLFALSEYVRATGDSEAAALAATLFRLLEEHAHDDEFGGYREFLAADWTPVGDRKAPFGSGPPGAKTLNTQLHVLEGLTAYCRMSGDPQVRDRLAEIVVILSAAGLVNASGAAAEHFSADWTPLRKPAPRVSYGHDLERLWMLADGCAAAGLPRSTLVTTLRGIFASALHHGYDRRDGGFYNWGRPGRPAFDRDKLWWVQAESLVAAMTMFTLTAQPLYARCFLQTLEWIEKRQVDWQDGEWFWAVDESGRPQGYKAGQWKTPYHNGRAMLVCLEQLAGGPGG